MKIAPFKCTGTALVIVLLASFSSCTSHPETPEAVVKNFTEYMAIGNCDAAMELCAESAEMGVQANIDAGCKPYETTVDSVTCTIDGNKASCTCYEHREDIGEIAFPYELEKMEDKWMIMVNTKDIGDIEEDSQSMEEINTDLQETLDLLEEVEEDIEEREAKIDSIVSNAEKN